ncbi:MAG: hypothetical protein ACI8Q9_001909, partial [Planctomycetota bacterium]
MASLSEQLVDAGLSRERLDECRRLANTTGDSLDRAILSRGYMPEEKLLEVYAGHLGYEFAGVLEGTVVPPAFVDVVPVHFSRNYNLVALGNTDDGALRVATCSPLEP